MPLNIIRPYDIFEEFFRFAGGMAFATKGKMLVFEAFPFVLFPFVLFPFVFFLLAFAPDVPLKTFVTFSNTLDAVFCIVPTTESAIYRVVTKLT